MDQILYLEDSDFCEPFAKLKAGDEVTISVEAVLANSGGIAESSKPSVNCDLKQGAFDKRPARS